jgi:hypothetical protein
MSRSVDVNMIANQILEASGGSDRDRNNARREAIQFQFERLTMGLAEYERQEVAWMVNFRLAATVL